MSVWDDNTTVRRVSTSRIRWCYRKIAKLVKSIDFDNFSIDKKSKNEPIIPPYLAVWIFQFLKFRDLSKSYFTEERLVFLRVSEETEGRFEQSSSKRFGWWYFQPQRTKLRSIGANKNISEGYFNSNHINN